MKVATFLRDDPRCQFSCFIDVTAVDWPGRQKRFDVVYHLLSPAKNTRIRVKIEADETTPIASIIGVYIGADGSSGRSTTFTEFCSPDIRTCAGC